MAQGKRTFGVADISLQRSRRNPQCILVKEKAKEEVRVLETEFAEEIQKIFAQCRREAMTGEGVQAGGRIDTSHK